MPARVNHDIDDIYNNLDNYLKSLEDCFIKHLLEDEDLDPPNSELNIKAYCILSHGAIEEFMEKIVIKVMEESIGDYIRSRGKKINRALISLVGFCGKLKIDDDYSNSETKSFDYIRKELVDIKSTFSNKINDNHGISISHLRGLLTPVGLHIKDEPDLKDSLKHLTNERGSYAHKGGLKKIINPKDAKKYVKDCRKIGLDIKNKAKNIFQ